MRTQALTSAIFVFVIVQACMAEATSSAEGQWVEFSGRVVDDQTDRAVTGFALQSGWPDPRNPSKIGWGGHHYSGHHEEGRFSIQTGRSEGKKLWVRVLADGYLPQPVTPEPLVSPGSAKKLAVRLKRGYDIHGQVVDHAQSPVAGAKVFLGGYQHLRLVDGQPEHFYCSKTTTDEDGRFVLRGCGEEAKAIIVSADHLNVYSVPLPKLGRHSRIELPKPATIILHYDIEGEKLQGQFHLYLKTWEMEDWRRVVASVQKPTVRNKGETVVKNLTPGAYSVGRYKELRLGDMGRGGFCDHRTITAEAGRVIHADFVRRAGHPIEGHIVALQEAEVPGAFIHIKPSEATGDPDDVDEWRLTTFDFLICDVTGRFKTARIAPGSYAVVANAYRPEPQTGVLRSGIRLPDFIGIAKVTVPEQGLPPRVRIDMQPCPGQFKALE